MEPNDQKKLHTLRKQLQDKIRVKDEVKGSIGNWIELYDYILQQNLAHQLCSLARIGEQDLRLWIDTLNNEYGQYRFTEDILKELPWKSWLQQIELIYPNQHFMRYIPPIPLISSVYSDPQEGLEACIDALLLDNQKVYLYYFPHSPILEISLNTLVEHADNFFYMGFDEAVIVPQSLKWMIFYSMEEDWYAGRVPKL